MDQSYLNFLDQSTAKQNEAKSYLDSLPTERQAGVDKLKTEQGYAEKQSAVDAATKTLYETQRRLDALPKQAQQRMSGRNVTQSQLDRIIGAESQPLAEQYKSAGLGREQAGQSLSLIDQALKDYTNQYNQDAQMKYQGTLAQASDLFNRYQAGSGEYWKQQEAEMQRQAQLAAKEQAAQQVRLQQQQMALQERLAKLGMGGNDTKKTNTGYTPGSTITIGGKTFRIDENGNPIEINANTDGFKGAMQGVENTVRGVAGNQAVDRGLNKYNSRGATFNPSSLNDWSQLGTTQGQSKLVGDTLSFYRGLLGW